MLELRVGWGYQYVCPSWLELKGRTSVSCDERILRLDTSARSFHSNLTKPVSHFQRPRSHGRRLALICWCPPHSCTVGGPGTLDLSLATKHMKAVNACLELAGFVALHAVGYGSSRTEKIILSEDALFALHRRPITHIHSFVNVTSTAATVASLPILLTILYAMCGVCIQTLGSCIDSQLGQIATTTILQNETKC